MTAGRLLERCELKGFTIGGARISPVHANFIENTGAATSADVIALMAEARRRARERFGIELEHEVQMVGARVAAGRLTQRRGQSPLLHRELRQAATNLARCRSVAAWRTPSSSVAARCARRRASGG